MPTAPWAVQAVARYIAPALADEGVARMIEALVLAPPGDARSTSERLAAEASAAVAAAVDAASGIASTAIDQGKPAESIPA